MKTIISRSAILLKLAILLFSVSLRADPITVRSPGKHFSIRFNLGSGGRPTYAVRWKDRDIIASSGLGFVLDGGVDWTKDFRDMRLVSQGQSNSHWKPVWGERASIPDRYHSVTVRYNRPDATGTMKIEARAYDEGVAFRYVIEAIAPQKRTEDPAGGHTQTPAGGTVNIAAEQTEFRFTDDHHVWAVTSAQGKYSRVKLSEARHSLERPCVLETSDDKVIAVAEAALVDYARMRVRRSEAAPHTLVSRLHGPVASRLPLTTPWRVVMAGDTAGEVLENNHLILNLNAPSAIKDTSWIRPGKVIRDVSLSTEGGKACVDFSVKHGLQYIEFDAGWYGPQGEASSDARTDSRRGLDLQAVLGYAKARNIGVFLYVNRRHLESQLDQLLPLYKSWGIAGIKYGFVQHGSQEWTAWLHDAIRKTAEHKMLVDVHDEYRMTGWERTYPNFMTAEGIGGDETRPPHEQVLANLFTRMIAGPADHTFCYFSGHVERTSTHASQLAKSVCFFSPIQFLYWYDRPASVQNEPELAFWKHLPTTWDETRVLHSKIGHYAVIARRKGQNWFMGCLNAVEPRTFDVSLDFLPEGQDFTAIIYSDDELMPTRTRVGIEHRRVNAKTVLKASMGKTGGIAVRIVPGRATSFRHPGILHTQEEIGFVRRKIEAGERPWKDAWELLRAHKYASLDHKPRPWKDVVRGASNNPNRGASQFMNDGSAAYAHALQWVLAGGEAHAEKAVEILNAYAATLKSVGGHDARLLVGMAGIKYVTAAELVRHTYKGWPEKDQRKFEGLLRHVFYAVIKDFYPTANGNWDAAMIQTMLAMGVYLDDRDMFNRAVRYFLAGKGNGAITKYFNESGQCQESGRDQAHTQMGLGYLGCAAEIAWKQGLDLYGAADNRLLKGYEYTAKYNLGHDVPYEPYRSVEGRYHYMTISPKARGRFSCIYERVYNHYHNRRGLEMNYTKRVIEKIRPEPRQSAYLSWGTLMHADVGE